MKLGQTVPLLWGLVGEEHFGYSYRELNWRYINGDPFSNNHSDWRYRYNAMGEREQKRLYHAPLADSVAGSPYPWVQYILGGSKDQLAVWHGQQMTSLFCDTVKLRNVYLYPTEYLTYGVGRQSSLLTKPDGTKEYRFFDHLGSSRAVLSGSNVTFSDYAPFGGLLAGGNEPRKGFIGKEKDNESSLRNLGVRQYDDNVGRFLSVDALWESYTALTPYHYSLNSPLLFKDPSGFMTVTIDGADAEIATRELDAVSSLEIRRDANNGQLSGTRPEGPLTASDQRMLDAINSTTVNVNLHTTNQNEVTSIDGSLQKIIVGMYNGSQVDNAGIAQTSQFININHARAWNRVGGGTIGQTVLHEINESFLGGQTFPNNQYNSDNFNFLHNATLAIDPPQGIVTTTSIQNATTGLIDIGLSGTNGTEILYRINPTTQQIEP